MKQKQIFSLLMAMMMVLSLCACGQGNAPAAPPASPPAESGGSPAPKPEGPATITLTDNVGRQVELPCPVERCAVALRYTNELIRACGAIDKVVAVDLNTAQDRDYWGMFDPGQVIGKSQRELDYERIIQLAPQVLILPSNGSYEEAAEKLAPFGIQVFVLSGYDTANFASQCEVIGKMFGVEEQAEKFCSYFTEKLDYIHRQLEGVEPRTYYYEGNTDYTTALPGDYFVMSSSSLSLISSSCSFFRSEMESLHSLTMSFHFWYSCIFSFREESLTSAMLRLPSRTCAAHDSSRPTLSRLAAYFCIACSCMLSSSPIFLIASE